MHIVECSRFILMVVAGCIMRRYLEYLCSYLMVGIRVASSLGPLQECCCQRSDGVFGAHVYVFLLGPCRSGMAGASGHMFSFKDSFKQLSKVVFRFRIRQEDVCPSCLTPLSVLSVPLQARGWAWDGASDGSQIVMR